MPSEPEVAYNVFVQWVCGKSEALDEHSVYTVNVKYHPNDPIHAAILKTGFSNGNCSALLSKGIRYRLKNYHHIEVVEKVAEIPSHGPFKS